MLSHQKTRKAGNGQNPHALRRDNDILPTERTPRIRQFRIGQAVKRARLQAAIQKMQPLHIHIMPYRPVIHIGFFRRRSDAQKTEHRNQRHRRSRAGPKSFPHLITGRFRTKRRAHAKIGKLMTPHVFQHEIHQRHIVRSMLENPSEHVGIGGLREQNAIENFPRLKRPYAEQHPKRVQHRVHGAEIIYFSLIERLHGKLPNRRMKQEDPSARARAILLFSLSYGDNVTMISRQEAGQSASPCV